MTTIHIRSIAHMFYFVQYLSCGCGRNRCMRQTKPVAYHVREVGYPFARERRWVPSFTKPAVSDAGKDKLARRSNFVSALLWATVRLYAASADMIKLLCEDLSSRNVRCMLKHIVCAPQAGAGRYDGLDQAQGHLSQPTRGRSGSSCAPRGYCRGNRAAAQRGGTGVWRIHFRGLGRALGCFRGDFRKARNRAKAERSFILPGLRDPVRFSQQGTLTWWTCRQSTP